MHGVVAFWDDPPNPEAIIGEKHRHGPYHPGAIWNCFPGHTSVSSPSGVQTLWRAAYSGDLIEIQVHNGRFLATPNHPILTQHGWVPVSALNIGDDLVQLPDVGRAAMQPDMHHGVSTFAEMFEAYASGSCRSRRGLAFDFHGDVFPGEVDCVTVHDYLPLNEVAALFESVRDFLFSDAYGRVCQLISGVAAQIMDTSVACFSGERLAFADSGAFHADRISFGCRPWFDTVYDQIPSNAIALDTEVSSDSLFTPLQGQVQTSQFSGRDDVPGAVLLGSISGILKRSRKMASAALRSDGEPDQRFTGRKALTRVTQKCLAKSADSHVFTLESGSGWYCVTPANIIAKNCRCVSLPLISLDEISWPARVHQHGNIRYMTRAAFRAYSGIEEAA
jgi:hypothetical protein